MPMHKAHKKTMPKGGKHMMDGHMMADKDMPKGKMPKGKAPKMAKYAKRKGR